MNGYAWGLIILYILIFVGLTIELIKGFKKIKNSPFTSNKNN